jgi:acyl-coenzyme A thioesterase 13
VEKNKSLETARRLLEVTSTTEQEAEAEAEAEQLPSLPSGFYDAFVLRGIRVVQALQPGTLLCHFTVPSRLLVSHLVPLLSPVLSPLPRVELCHLIPDP